MASGLAWLWTNLWKHMYKQLIAIQSVTIVLEMCEVLREYGEDSFQMSGMLCGKGNMEPQS